MDKVERYRTLTTRLLSALATTLKRAFGDSDIPQVPPL
jgi:hypothetical protein